MFEKTCNHFTPNVYVAIVNTIVAEYAASIFVIVLSFMKLLPDNLKTLTSLLSKSTDPPTPPPPSQHPQNILTNLSLRELITLECSPTKLFTFFSQLVQVH